MNSKSMMICLEESMKCTLPCIKYSHDGYRRLKWILLRFNCGQHVLVQTLSSLILVIENQAQTFVFVGFYFYPL